MARTKEEQLTDRVQAFHQSLNGHRRSPYWPDVPKDQQDVSVCEAPQAHAFKTKEATLGKRAYTITYCETCPLAFIDPAVED